MTTRNEAAAESVDEIVEQIIERYAQRAQSLGWCGQFVSAALGHAVTRGNRRDPLIAMLMEAADTIERRPAGVVPEGRPQKWKPRDDVSEGALHQMVALIDELHDVAGVPPLLVDAAAVRAGLVMLGWHDPKIAAAMLRAQAAAIRNVPAVT